MTRFDVFAAILRDLGTPVGGRLLDFGCGDGSLVKGAVDRGYDAYGCDIEGASFVRTRSVLREMTEAGRLLPIGLQPYRLPFEDESFDVVVSDQVFEHVQNYPEALAEISRVMKPGGCCLHMYQPRTRLVEGHTFVPLAGMFRARWWLTLWACLGVRNRYQRGKDVKEVVRRNADYLPKRTNYLSAREIRAHFERYFRHVEFAERHFLAYSRRLKVMRVAPSLYRALASAVIYARK
jgi:ubiquinone/menaquinone biosynthesis C-methylase UbiE